MFIYKEMPKNDRFINHLVGKKTMIQTPTAKTMSPDRTLLAGLHTQLREKEKAIDKSKLTSITDTVFMTPENDLMRLVNGQHRFSAVGMDLVPHAARNGQNVYRSQNSGLVLAQEQKRGGIDIYPSMKSFMELFPEKKPAFYDARFLVSFGVQHPVDRMVFVFSKLHAFKVNLTQQDPHMDANYAKVLPISNKLFPEGYMSIASLPHKHK